MIIVVSYLLTLTRLLAGAIDELGVMPFYGEQCASMLTVTFSSDTSSMRQIVSAHALLSTHALLKCTVHNLQIT